MNKLYSVHDHWTDINKKNDVDIESIDGVITGIKVNGEDYGGSITWESVYSGTIDPEGEVSPFTADISLTMTARDSIKVVYDGVEYVLLKQVFNDKIYYGAVPASLPADIDFTNYPFLIQVMPNTIKVYTETAGLHTLAISVPQSGGGGSSDFSAAEVTLNGGGGLLSGISISLIYVDDHVNALVYNDLDTRLASGTYITPLYKGTGFASISLEDNYVVTGNATVDEEGRITITGNFTVTKP